MGEALPKAIVGSIHGVLDVENTVDRPNKSVGRCDGMVLGAPDGPSGLDDLELGECQAGGVDVGGTADALGGDAHGDGRGRS